MSSKRQRGEGSLAIQGYDNKMFINKEVVARYQAELSCTFVLETGSGLDLAQDGELAQIIAERGWFKLTMSPDQAAGQILREFYANLHEGNI